MELLLLPVLMRPDALLLLSVPLPLDDVEADADAAYAIDNGIVMHCWPLSRNMDVFFFFNERGELIT